MWGGKQLAVFGSGAAAIPVTTSGADVYYFPIPFRCRPIRVGFTITTAITIQAAIINFDSVVYTATGSQTRGNCDVGQITLPLSAYRNKCYYDDTDYVAADTGTWKATLSEGDYVVVEVSQASTAGAGFPWLLVEVDPEQPANNTNMTKTA